MVHKISNLFFKVGNDFSLPLPHLSYTLYTVSTQGTPFHLPLSIWKGVGAIFQQVSHTRGLFKSPSDPMYVVGDLISEEAPGMGSLKNYVDV